MNIYIDKKLPKAFISEYEIYEILKNDTDTVITHKGLDIIVSMNKEEGSIYVELHDGKKRKKYRELN